MDSDYVMQFKIKNAPMLRIMRINGMETAADLSRATGLNQSTIGDYLNLKRSALTLRGGWRLSVLKIAETLKVIPEMLFPEQHYATPLEKNSAEIELSSNDVYALMGKSYEDSLEDQLLEAQEYVGPEELLDTLGPREKKVIEYYYGINSMKEKSLSEIGEIFAVSRSRIAQIRDKALRRLRHPGRTKLIRRLEVSRG